MRQILVYTAAACFTLGTICFGVFFVQVGRIVIDMPSVDVGLPLVAAIQAWGWRFVGLYVAGTVLLLFVREPRKPSKVDPDADSA